MLPRSVTRAPVRTFGRLNYWIVRSYQKVSNHVHLSRTTSDRQKRGVKGEPGEKRGWPLESPWENLKLGIVALSLKERRSMEHLTNEKPLRHG
jgi:hypothetical protein